MKDGLRFLGVDDGPREAEKLIGVSYRGTEFIEQVEISSQESDKGEATQDFLELFNRFKQDIAAFFLDGITFNGFNIPDINFLSQQTDTPVIAITKNSPDRKAVKNAMQDINLSTEVVEKLPETYERNNVYLQFVGCNKAEAFKFVDKATLQGDIPEAVRVADLIGNGFHSSQ